MTCLLKDPDFKKPMKGLDFEPVDRIDNAGKKVRASRLPEKIVVMPKLNGVRIRWDVIHQCFRFNSGIMVGSCDHLVEQIRATQHMRYLPVDGEAYTHDPAISFSTINGLARRKKSSKETEVLEFHCFEIALYEHLHTKIERLTYIEKMFQYEPDMPGLQRVPWTVVDKSKVDAVFRLHLECRYEGIMICDPDYQYMEGKGEWMWKYKPVYDAEFGFVGFEYATEGRNVGMFAALVLAMPDGRTFTCAGIGDKTKQELLANPPAKGTPMTIEYGDLSDTGIPIFPRFKAVRYDQ